MISSTFSSAQSGLNASRTAIETVSTNIANENTEGYVKRVTNLSELSNADSYADGVQVSSVERQTNEYLFEKIMNESSYSSYYSKNSDIYELTETIFTETDESGLSVDLDSYFQAVENLRSDPNNEIYQAGLESSALNLVENMQSLYTDLNDVQDSLTSEIYDDAKAINSLLDQIVEVNDKIVKSGESLDLLDKRDTLEQELATYVDIEVDTSNSDYYKLSIAGETAIFHNTLSYEVEVVEDPTKQENVYDYDFSNSSALDETLTISLNNNTTISVTATAGDTSLDVKTKIMDAINNDSVLNDTLEASLSNDGNLIISSKEKGEDVAFDLTILNDTTLISKNSSLSEDATSDVHLEILDKELDLSSGSMKALVENVTTTDSNNVISTYKQSLNDLAYSLIDITSSYITNSDDTYVYGDDDTQVDISTLSTTNLNLFSGSSVMNISFDNTVIDVLSQNDLDYLADIQWNEDINISTVTQNSSQGFSEFLNTLRVNISSNKESIDSKLETQEAILTSLNSTYDELTKVDSDEELINLMQYQASYQANAKVITAVDEMIQTLLAM